MKLSNATWLIALTAGLGCWTADQERSLQAQESGALVMVVNKTNAGAAGMNLSDARKLVLGETGNWKNGAKVLVILAPGGSGDRSAVLKKICGMSEAAYTRYEMQAAFTGGTAATVHEAATDAAIKGIVKANPGAVGFLHKSQVDDTVQSVMEIDR